MDFLLLPSKLERYSLCQYVNFLFPVHIICISKMCWKRQHDVLLPLEVRRENETLAAEVQSNGETSTGDQFLFNPEWLYLKMVVWRRYVGRWRCYVDLCWPYLCCDFPARSLLIKSPQKWVSEFKMGSWHHRIKPSFASRYCITKTLHSFTGATLNCIDILWILLE